MRKPLRQEDQVDKVLSEDVNSRLMRKPLKREDQGDKVLSEDLNSRLMRKPLKREDQDDKVLSEDVNSRLMRKTRKLKDQNWETVPEDLKNRRTRTPGNSEEADLKCRVMIKSLKKEEQLQAEAGLVEDINSRLMKKKVGAFENQGTYLSRNFP
jgi:hypothetical protein